METTYLNRSIDEELEAYLEAFGAVLITGPKWCGKTTSASMNAKSILKLQDPDRSQGYLLTAETKPSLLLEGDKPRLIDEWQMA
ncbi:MAG: AAA family ATPase, partial [Bacteroidales bacterium]|nr:AAA family ATPase [Bacteroidales bacterium]